MKKIDKAIKSLIYYNIINIMNMVGGGKGKQMDRSKVKVILGSIVIIGILIVFMLVQTSNERNVEQGQENLRTLPENEYSKGSTLEFELISYEYATMQFKNISATDLTEMLLKSDEEIIVFTGRATCQWCRKVAPILSEAGESYEGDIFYLDSENTDKDTVLKEFRRIYKIETVPSVIKFWGKDQYEKLDVDVRRSDNELKNEIRKWINDI
ncbi:MAG TPA: hypothetical protein IAB13_04985 [Candidatus Avanaerovorax faecigallinarum]|nr:hypothetical protein [Candidatus Avanaerovorax faecigallinarum]